jgi:hypothetical protein
MSVSPRHTPATIAAAAIDQRSLESGFWLAASFQNLEAQMAVITQKRLKETHGRLMTVKAIGDTAIVACVAKGRAGEHARGEEVYAGVIIELVERVLSNSGSEFDCRAFASHGPSVGALVGQSSVSFEFFGGAISTARSAVREVPWGHAVASSRLLSTWALMNVSELIDFADDTVLVNGVKCGPQFGLRLQGFPTVFVRPLYF